MNEQTPDLSDSRWGSYIPWFLREKDFAATGNFLRFFERVGQLLDRLFTFNEPGGIHNPSHFGALLETESLQRFRHDRSKPLNNQIKAYFNPVTLNSECIVKLEQDPEVKKAKEELELKYPKPSSFSSGPGIWEDINREKCSDELERVKENRRDKVYISILNERLGVLEVILRILANSPYVTDPSYISKLIADIRRFFAESKIMLDIKDIPPLIVPMEEPLLQREIIDNLLPRLSEKFPERAKELIQCYHSIRMGKDLDTIFSEAFKSLEEIARSITGNDKFFFKEEMLKKYFPLLHPTIHQTIIKLAGHRGDEAGHGRASPDLHEIRYLLFSICNIALLILDYTNIKRSL